MILNKEQKDKIFLLWKDLTCPNGDGMESYCNHEGNNRYMIQGFFGIRLWFTAKDNEGSTELYDIVVKPNSGLKDRSVESISNYLKFTPNQLEAKLVAAGFVVNIDSITFK